MQKFELVIQNPTGLHARPARFLVDVAKKFHSTIQVRYGAKQVNAKSLVSLLTLGVPSGQQIQVDVNGEDEEAAAIALTVAVQDGLGETWSIDTAATLSQVPAPVRTSIPEAKSAVIIAARPVAVLEPVGLKSGAAFQAGEIIQGVAGAPGIAIGEIYRFERRQLEVAEHSAGKVQEQTALQAALEIAQQQLTTLRDQVAERGAKAEKEIFEAHLGILTDPDLLETVDQLIADGCSATKAWQQSYMDQSAKMAALPDPVLSERAIDIRDVGERVLRLLTGSSESFAPPADRPVIIVAYDLTPSETAALDPKKVLGFCTVDGGPHAHAAILARAIGLPAIVSAGSRVLDLPNGTGVILDGSTGKFIVAPDETALTSAKVMQEQERQRKSAALLTANDPAVTSDGRSVEIAVNIGGLVDAQKALKLGAEAVGLLRTEFLFLDQTSAPSEETQFEVYRDIGLAMGSKSVIVRTLDIGGDKPLPYLVLPAEANPFMGQRGIRLCLAQPDLFRQQLRAILRASTFGKLRIMFPMIADVVELRAAKIMLEEIRAELDVPPVEVGIMIELPSAAIMADVLAEEVDFFSIGTNDLTQYTLAMDRTNRELTSRADGLHPAVLRLIAMTVKAAHTAGKWVGICGELASDPQAVPILLGLGVDELSVSSPLIPTLKAQIRLLDYTHCQEQAQVVLGCATAEQVRQRGIS